MQNSRDGEPRLNLHLTQRSCDIALGIPYNIAGYAFLLTLFGHFTKIKPGIFAHTFLADVHEEAGAANAGDRVVGLDLETILAGAARDPRPQTTEDRPQADAPAPRQ